jgi:prolipoprotein diacylglyceryl transferase
MAVILSMPGRVAFSIFGFEVMWYGVIIACAMLLGIGIVMYRAKKKGLNSEIILDILLLTIPLAVIGARFAYVISHWQNYTGQLLQIFAIRQGGLAIQGGIVGGIAGVIIMCRIKKESALLMADLLAPSLILGQAIGRWGNYFNMEVYGTQTTLPWAIQVIDPKLGIITVHPTFLYESLWNLLSFGMLLYYDRHIKKNNGEIICLYLILYSFGRFFIEFLRTDHVYIWGSVNLAQAICVLLAGIGIATLILIRKNIFVNNRR